MNNTPDRIALFADEIGVANGAERCFQAEWQPIRYTTIEANAEHLLNSRPPARTVKRNGERPMKFLREFLAAMLSGVVLLATTSSAVAMPMYAPPYQESDQAPLTATDIENIVSPIALYPDQLIAQILGAATYPDQVTAASNYVNNTKLKRSEEHTSELQSLRH